MALNTSKCNHLTSLQRFELKFSGATVLHGVEFLIFLFILAWALRQCSANALSVIVDDDVAGCIDCASNLMYVTLVNG